MKKISLTTISLIIIFGMSFAEASMSCKQFGSWENAQEYLKAKKKGYKSLDRDKDGIACDGLKAAEETQRARIRIYQDGEPYSVGSIYGSIGICEKEKETLQRNNAGTGLTYQCEML